MKLRNVPPRIIRAESFMSNLHVGIDECYMTILGMIRILCKLIVPIYSSIAIDVFYILYIYVYVLSYVINIWVTYIYGMGSEERE